MANIRRFLNGLWAHTAGASRWYQSLLIGVAAFILLTWLAIRAGLPAVTAAVMSAIWVGLVWSVRGLVSRWTPKLGRPTAWAAVLLLFAATGGAMAGFFPLCDGRCQPADVGTVIILSVLFPLTVLVYTGPFMWVAHRIRKRFTSRRHRHENDVPVK